MTMFSPWPAHNRFPENVVVGVLEYPMAWFAQLFQKRSASRNPEAAPDPQARRRRQEPRLPAAEQLTTTSVVPVAGPRRR